MSIPADLSQLDLIAPFHSHPTCNFLQLAGQYSLSNCCQRFSRTIEVNKWNFHEHQRGATGHRLPLTGWAGSKTQFQITART